MHSQELIITGYSGFLGSNLLKKLIQETELQLYLFGRKAIAEGSHTKWQYMDLQEDYSLQMPGRFQQRSVLIHMASILPGHSAEIDYDTIIQNEIKLLENYYKAGVSKVVFASTGGVYNEGKCIEEDSLPTIKNDYSRYKSAIEKRICELWPKDSLILRYFFPFGEGQRLPRLFPGLITKVNNNEMIHIVGDQGLLTNPIYIEDAIEAMLFLMKSNCHGIYNIGGRTTISLKELVTYIGEKVNRSPIIIESVGMNPLLIGSINKILALNNNLINTPFYESLNRTITWVLENK